MPLILSGNVATALGTGYDVDNSCRFDDGSSAYMHKTPGSAGSSRKVTISCWYKKAQPTNGTTWQQILNCSDSDGNPFFAFGLKADKFTVSSGSGSTELQKQSTQVLRDIGAWYHLCVGIDTTDGTAGDRVKMYINGTRVTSFAASTNPDQNYDFPSLNTTSYAINIGRDDYGGGEAYLDGYLAEVVFIDGSALAPTSFGEFDEDSPTIWKPKDVSGLTFGTQGFYLDFEDSSALGDDKSGNGNDYTANNLAATDQSTDTPTNNFCVMSPLAHQTRAQTLTEGNLQAYYSSGSNWGTNWASIAAKNGKWYAEVLVTAYGSNGSNIGIVNVDMTAFPNQAAISNGQDEFSAGYYSTGILQRNSETSHSGNTNDDYDSYGADDIVSMAMDLDNGFLYWAKNGTWQNSGDPTSAGTGTGGVATSHLTAGDTYAFSSNIRSGTTISWNFGNPPTTFSISSGNADANGYGNFEYAPPSGYLALCTKNLAEEG